MNFSTPPEDHSTSLLSYNELASNHNGGYFYGQDMRFVNDPLLLIAGNRSWVLKKLLME